MSSMQYKILYPVDFSKRSTLAIQHVRVWVEHFRAALDTLHIVDNNTPGPPYDPSFYEEQSRLRERRTADLEYFSDQYFGKDVARPAVLTGDRANLIRHFADREQVDLIMLCRDHQSLISRFFHDSLTAQLLDRCRASIWMTEHFEDTTPSIPSNVLCAVHLGDDPTLDAHNHRILYTIRDLVSNFGSDVTFLHVTGNEDTSKPSSEQRTKTGFMLWLEQAHCLFGSPVKLLRTSGRVIAAIRETAKKVRADLVVVGRMRPGAVSLGRQSRLLKIDHALCCPVLSVW
ncbi:universal stress protein [Alloacidobacterium dinghuense]|uniref:Universal stress protein n=2 Tax=Alloacidobacterium dinghuense TaxID=2763107 RepID=A0A7G8BD88_9BACT|nr:universal stress protein [Alloacidobacterium dinghuense]